MKLSEETMEEEEHEMRGLRSRRRMKLSEGISCCFTSQHHHRRSASSSSSSPWSPRRPSSPSFPEMKDKCRNFFISRMGPGRHRRHSSADFSYDPLSYALNFNDNDEHHDDALMNFTARLPSSPPCRSSNHDLRRGFEDIPTTPPVPVPKREISLQLC